MPGLDPGIHLKACAGLEADQMLRAIRSTAAIAASGTIALVALIACSPDTKTQPPTPGFTPGYPWFPPAPIARNEFDPIYIAWRQRIAQPDMQITQDTRAWTAIPEFQSLVGLGDPAVPFLLERLRDGDFRAVRALEAISRVPSRQLYPEPLPPAGTFGLQGVAQLWLSPQAASLAYGRCVEDLYTYSAPYYCPAWPDLSACYMSAMAMCQWRYDLFWAAPPPP